MELAIQKLNATAQLPTKAHADDAGWDLYADSTVTIPPHSNKTIGTGIALALPEHTVGLIWDRSSVAGSRNLTTIGGVIDAGYRGEIRIILSNLNDTPVRIERGKKIAQLIIQPLTAVTLREVERLDASSRGKRGFGSSGK